MVNMERNIWNANVINKQSAIGFPINACYEFSLHLLYWQRTKAVNRLCNAHAVRGQEGTAGADVEMDFPKSETDRFNHSEHLQLIGEWIQKIKNQKKKKHYARSRITGNNSIILRAQMPTSATYIITRWNTKKKRNNIEQFWLDSVPIETLWMDFSAAPTVSEIWPWPGKNQLYSSPEFFRFVRSLFGLGLSGSQFTWLYFGKGRFCCKIISHRFDGDRIQPRSLNATRSFFGRNLFHRVIEMKCEWNYTKLISFCFQMR